MKRKVKQIGVRRGKHRQANPQDVLTPREIARATGIGILTIYDLLKSGELPSKKVGKRFYGSRMGYEQWLAGFGQPAA
jgi:excisionase family DNA binding protein